MNEKEDSGKQRNLPARILVVDDHPLIRQGLIQLLDQEEGVEVCGEAETRDETVQKTVEHSPDLAILDLTLGEEGGIDFIKEYITRFPRVAVLVLSMHDETFYAERVLRAGARGYIMKGGSLDCVMQAIQTVLKGEIYLSGKMSAEVMRRLAGRNSNHTGFSPVATLSDREMAVFELIGTGKGPKEIAEHLHLSVKTIETYRSHLKKKLNLEDAKSLRKYAIQWLQNH